MEEIGKSNIVDKDNNPVTKERLSFLDVLYLLPLSPQVLLPQANLVISATHSKNVSTRAPAHPPHNVIKFKYMACPLRMV